MAKNKFLWMIGLGMTALIVATAFWILWPRNVQASVDDPRAALPVRAPHVDHSALLTGPYASGPEVTQACLECHPNSAAEMMATTHYTWESDPVQVEGRPEPVTVGKRNSLNNFCLGITSNWASCTSCHAGYGWFDGSYTFDTPTNVDCLVCHDNSGGYVKDKGGIPAEGVDLAAAAQSVGYPTRETCGGCHFNGGGGNAVKHGDLDESLYFPDDALDVHMGKNSMVCIDCHTTEQHEIRGRSPGVALELSNQATCIDCHNPQPHPDARLNAHTESVACQTCHIATFARKDATKMIWDWSTAGQDLPESVHEYLKIKGSFVYEEDVRPEYLWYSGIKDRYILHDKIDPTKPTLINTLSGAIDDSQAKIWPFKIHRAKQPYDTVNNILLQPRTGGEGGFWTSFDWVSALEMGSKDAGLPFSGQYGFAETWMYWPITHMVQPSEEALQCQSCHAPDGLLDWQALGYPGDPMEWGGRFSK